MKKIIALLLIMITAYCQASENYVTISPIFYGKVGIQTEPEFTTYKKMTAVFPREVDLNGVLPLC